MGPKIRAIPASRFLYRKTAKITFMPRGTRNEFVISSVKLGMRRKEKGNLFGTFPLGNLSSVTSKCQMRYNVITAPDYPDQESPLLSAPFIGIGRVGGDHPLQDINLGGGGVRVAVSSGHRVIFRGRVSVACHQICLRAVWSVPGLARNGQHDCIRPCSIG